MEKLVVIIEDNNNVVEATNYAASILSKSENHDVEVVMREKNVIGKVLSQV